MSDATPPTTAATTALAQLTGDASTWKGQSLLSVSQISCDGFALLHHLASRMRHLVQVEHGGSQACRHCVLATVFFEASTRTSCSFQVAMLRLGGNVVHVDASGANAATTANRAGGNSSVVKGETLSDTLKCLECYVDVSVVRHFQTGALLEVATAKPMINAGDGIGEHPTQALLDVFTILDELHLSTTTTLSTTTVPPKNKLVVIMLGDLKHGRTVHSLAKLLARIVPGMNGMTIDLRYVAPEGLEMPTYIQEQVAASSTSGESNIILQSSASSLTDDVLQDVDIMYVTRVQKERFESMEDYERVKGSYVVNKALLSRLNNHVRILHPLPRVDEISTDCDDDPRAAYFRQMENGMYVRMALLTLLLGKLNVFEQEQEQQQQRV